MQYQLPDYRCRTYDTRQSDLRYNCFCEENTTFQNNRSGLHLKKCFPLWDTFFNQLSDGIFSTFREKYALYRHVWDVVFEIAPVPCDKICNLFWFTVKPDGKPEFVTMKINFEVAKLLEGKIKRKSGAGRLVTIFGSLTVGITLNQEIFWLQTFLRQPWTKSWYQSFPQTPKNYAGQQHYFAIGATFEIAAARN